MPMPPGYRRIESARADGVAWEPLAEQIESTLARGTLYEFARQFADHRVLEGRGPAYAISLADTSVVVRRVRHGGLLAPLTRDLFFGSTRAPYELAVSARLRDRGVATPQVIAYARYRVAPGFRRADVLTREISGAADLLAILTNADVADPAPVWQAVRMLIDDLARVGAVHEDLNVKNVLIQRTPAAQPVAYALDVDRVRWRGAARRGDLARANWRRLIRSAQKRGIRLPKELPLWMS